MKILKYATIALFVLQWQIGCTEHNTSKSETKGDSPDTLQTRVIYGEDDRKDLYQVQDQTQLALADSTVAVVQRNRLVPLDEDYLQLQTASYASTYNLCSDEPFYSQRTLAYCSGFLVRPDVIVTAGHCISDEGDCSTTAFVFGFAIQSGDGQTPERVSRKEVYNCKRVIKSEIDSHGADYAVVELDREVDNHTPLRLRTQSSPKVGDALVVIGHPAGLPTKIAGGASVRTVNPGFLEANLDTYGGNSGSAVFNAVTHEVEGILVRGEMDYRSRNGCRVSYVCPNDGCRGEDVTRIDHVLEHIP